MHLFGETLSTASVVFLVAALGLALAFEFVNGFHDTANAVATVIYTHSLKPVQAVVWSGLFNFLGVLTSSGAVAYGIISLLPAELVLDVGTTAGFAMVFSLLLAAIAWNLGTWYLGLPASSSHTLIGAIMGVGLGHAMIAKGVSFTEGVNWAKAGEVGLSLLLSPTIGFVVAGLLLFTLRALVQAPHLFDTPEKDTPPPAPIRALLVATCTGVSFAHGSNDGQKGMGLIMLILIGILPGTFAVNRDADADLLRHIATRSAQVQTLAAARSAGEVVAGEAAQLELAQFLKTKADPTARTWAALADRTGRIGAQTADTAFRTMSGDVKRGLRRDIYLVAGAVARLSRLHAVEAAPDIALLDTYDDDLNSLTRFIPTWVKIAVALALGCGTMIGWKRIVVTVGERIGKKHLSYAQGASAELVAMSTIFAADQLGLPVSTTHVLSSGIAGTMFASKAGVRGDTVRNILLAWVLTLPATVLLGAASFASILYLFTQVFGLH